LDFTLDEGSPIAHGLVPGLARPAALIGLAEKGYLTLELSARGQGGHASMPPRTTAIGRVARAVARIEASPMPARLEGPAALMLERLAPALPFAQRAIIAHRRLLAPLLRQRFARSATTSAVIRTTAAATMIAGGIKENQL